MPPYAWLAPLISVPLLAACGGGGAATPQGSNNVVTAAVSPAAPVTGYVGEMQPVQVTFTSSDGAPATALAVDTGLSSLPPGWTSSASGFMCASVASTGCSLQLAFEPTVAGGGAFTLGFTYLANNGMPKSGAISISFTAGAVTLQLLAGSAGGPGNLDGVGTAARLFSPLGVVADSHGNLYVTDGIDAYATGGTLIRKITPAFTVSTFAGSLTPGTADGTGSAAGFSSLEGIAVDTADNLYVADSNAIRKITPDAVVTTYAGSARTAGAADGTGAAARFNAPAGIAIDSSGTLYVSDRLNDTIRKITPGAVVTTLAGTAGATGAVNGAGAAARFWEPAGVAVNSTDTLYVSDSQNNLIRQITPQGVVTTLAGSGNYACADGTGVAAGFSLPGLMSIDSSGTLYVGSSAAIRVITPQGVVSTLAGVCSRIGTVDGTGAAARFENPADIAVDGGGFLYVTDSPNNALRSVNAAGVVTTVVGEPVPFEGGLFTIPPLGVAVDAAGNFYVAEGDLLKITSLGAVTTLVSSSNPIVAVALGPDGMIYASQQPGSILKITPQGAITVLAGGGRSTGSADGTGSAAQFNFPAGIAVTAAGLVYVADSGNCKLRSITPAGVVTTLAGSGLCVHRDGTGAAAAFQQPNSLALSAGALYVADTFSVRKVTPAGVVSTFVDAGGLSIGGNGALAFDAAGNLYLADTYNRVIRKITPQAAMSTVIGKPLQVGIALNPLPASLAQPAGIAVLPLSGQLAILDDHALLVTRGL